MQDLSIANAFQRTLVEHQQKNHEFSNFSQKNNRKLFCKPFCKLYSKNPPNFLQPCKFPAHHKICMVLLKHFTQGHSKTDQHSLP